MEGPQISQCERASQINRTFGHVNRACVGPGSPEPQRTVGPGAESSNVEHGVDREIQRAAILCFGDSGINEALTGNTDNPTAGIGRDRALIDDIDGGIATIVGIVTNRGWIALAGVVATAYCHSGPNR